jgi:hypothetical protein
VAPAGSKRRKQFNVEERLLQALDFYARDAKVSLDDAADEAFRDLLKKHKRPLSLKDALKESARVLPANDPGSGQPKPKTRKRQR